MSVAGPILILGAGAIGGALGAAFLRAGHDAIFVDSAADHVAAIRSHGLRIEGPIRNGTVHAAAVLPDDLEGRFDCIFLCVKALHTRAAITRLAPHLAVRKRKTEAEAQLGAIAAAGARAGVATPLTACLIAMVQEIERGERALSRDNLGELAEAGQ